MTIKYVICGLFCLLFSSLIAPIILYVCKKLKASQSILHYVDKHQNKEGTPTMGGLIFILTTLFAMVFWVFLMISLKFIIIKMKDCLLYKKL